MTNKEKRANKEQVWLEQAGTKEKDNVVATEKANKKRVGREEARIMAELLNILPFEGIDDDNFLNEISVRTKFLL